jgi:hypothetical protein
MKKHLPILTAAILCFGLLPTFAQFGRMPGGPKFDAAMAKLFGDNTTFTAALESQIKQPSSDTITIPGKIAFDSGKVRMEMNMSEMKGSKMPPEAAAQMKSMGMDQMITLTRPDKNAAYLIYPGMESYVEMTTPPAKTGTNDNFKVEVTELGKDTVNGHPCVKNQVIVTDDKGVKHESTVWNATDLKKFPVKMMHVEQGSEITMLFNDVSFTKPAASQFDVPAGYTRYDSMQTMMQTEMMKKMGGGAGGGGGGFGMPPNR